MRNEVLEYRRIRNLRIGNNLMQRDIASYLYIKRNTYFQYKISVPNCGLSGGEG